MASSHKAANSLRNSWDTILGTKSHVRVLRVLDRTRESMTVRELARRAGEHLRSVQLAVSRLVETGVVERVGTGRQLHVRLNERHPLASTLRQLFEAERGRSERLVNQLKLLVKEHASGATAVWLREGTPPDGTGLEVSVLAPSEEVDVLRDSLQGLVAELGAREEVAVELRAWTRPDLEALGWSPLVATDQPILLWGVLPDRGAQAPSTSGRRSHSAADQALLNRAKQAATALESRPELVREAREELAERLSSASPQEAKTLREWQQVLDTMTIPRLRKWLVSHGERATRLRQSMPFVLLQAAEEQSGSARGSR
jgi:hypothetical protein